MPTYEYVCKSCGHIFEIVQSMRDDPLTECPQCGGVLRKVFAPPSIAFKGSGFYATDHGKKSKQQDETASSSTGEKEKSDGKASKKDADGDSGSSSSSSGSKDASSGSKDSSSGSKDGSSGSSRTKDSSAESSKEKPSS